MKNGRIARDGKNQIRNSSNKPNDDVENSEIDDDDCDNGKGKNNCGIVQQSLSVECDTTHTHIHTHTCGLSLARLLGGRDGDGRSPLQLAEHLKKVDNPDYIYNTK